MSVRITDELYNKLDVTSPIVKSKTMVHSKIKDFDSSIVAVSGNGLKLFIIDRGDNLICVYNRVRKSNNEYSWEKEDNIKVTINTTSRYKEIEMITTNYLGDKVALVIGGSYSVFILTKLNKDIGAWDFDTTKVPISNPAIHNKEELAALYIEMNDVGDTILVHGMHTHVVDILVLKDNHWSTHYTAVIEDMEYEVATMNEEGNLVTVRDRNTSNLRMIGRKVNDEGNYVWVQEPVVLSDQQKASFSFDISNAINHDNTLMAISDVDNESVIIFSRIPIPGSNDYKWIHTDSIVINVPLNECNYALRFLSNSDEETLLVSCVENDRDLIFKRENDTVYDDECSWIYNGQLNLGYNSYVVSVHVVQGEILTYRFVCDNFYIVKYELPHTTQ